MIDLDKSGFLMGTTIDVERVRVAMKINDQGVP